VVADVLKVGDHVAWSAQWLRSAGIVSGALPAARGVVLRVEEMRGGGGRLALVQWDQGAAKVGRRKRQGQVVNAANLVREDRLGLEPV
jgi:hypothetical protein